MSRKIRIKMLRMFCLPVLVCLFCACRHTAGPVVEALPFCEEGDTAAWGLMSVEGEVIVPAGTWRHAPTSVIQGRFAVPDDKGYFRLYDWADTGQPLGTKSYYRLGYFFAGVTVAQSSPVSPFVLIDRQGRETAVLDSTIQLIHNYVGGRALACTATGRYGYVDEQGQWAIPAVYDYAADFAEGLALVGRRDADGQMGYAFVDTRGAVVLTLEGVPPCLLGDRYAEGLLACRELSSGHCVYLDKKGKLALRLPAAVRSASSFCEGLAVVQSFGGRYGVLNRQGRMVVAMDYTGIRILSSGRVLLCQDGRWTLREIAGGGVSALSCDSLSPVLPGGKLVARQDGRVCLMDADGQWSGGVWAGRMSVDAVAFGEEPQVFVRKPQDQVGKSPRPFSESPRAFSESSRPNNRLVLTVEGEDVPQSDVPARVKHDVAVDWRSVGRENPFYAEAMKVVSGQLKEEDAEHRRIILNYVEHLRTSYTTKDIDFLTQLFSERALIVVGTVVRASAREQDGYLTPAQVIYNVKSKKEYLKRLKEIFHTNRHIDVHFSDFKIMRHPTMPGIYGVGLRQQYKSDSYSDDGYLFLLWDFRHPSMPKIHVRTWQPAFFDGHRPLSKEDVLDIRNFNLQ